MKRIHYLVIMAILLMGACGDGNEEVLKRRKAVKDSIRAADSIAWMRAQADIQKKAYEDSIMAEKEYLQELARYDSLRQADSLKIKYKRRPPVKPAPKRQLGGKSPVK
jgi:uncharacterized membrane protein